MRRDGRGGENDRWSWKIGRRVKGPTLAFKTQSIFKVTVFLLRGLWGSQHIQQVLCSWGRELEQKPPYTSVAPVWKRWRTLRSIERMANNLTDRILGASKAGFLSIWSWVVQAQSSATHVFKTLMSPAIYSTSLPGHTVMFFVKFIILLQNLLFFLWFLSWWKVVLLSQAPQHRIYALSDVFSNLLPRSKSYTPACPSGIHGDICPLFSTSTTTLLIQSQYLPLGNHS